MGNRGSPGRRNRRRPCRPSGALGEGSIPRTQGSRPGLEEYRPDGLAVRRLWEVSETGTTKSTASGCARLHTPEVGLRRYTGDIHEEADEEADAQPRNPACSR